MNRQYPKSKYYGFASVKNGLPRKVVENYRQMVPNRLPLSSHKVLALGLFSAAQAHGQRGHKLVQSVRCILDDIVQCEHPPSAGTMTQEEFHALYYPGVDGKDFIAIPVDTLRTVRQALAHAGIPGNGYDPRYKDIVSAIDKLIGGAK